MTQTYIYTDQEKMEIVAEINRLQELGMTQKDAVKKLGKCDVSTIYKWKQKFGNIDITKASTPKVRPSSDEGDAIIDIPETVAAFVGTPRQVAQAVKEFRGD